MRTPAYGGPDEAERLRAAHTPCPHCGNTGAILDFPEKGQWSQCDCSAGVEFGEEIRRGEAEIAAGLGTRWEDIRRDR